MRSSRISASHPASGMSSGRTGNFDRFVFGKAKRLRAFVADSHYLLSIIELEYRFQRSVVFAAGTKVMNGLAATARFLQSVSDGSRVVLHKFITLKLSLLFYKLSNLTFEVANFGCQRALSLGSMRGVLLSLQAKGASLDEFSIQRLGCGGYLRVVAQIQRRLECTSRSGNATHDCHEVHRNPPVVDEGVVGTQDSTACGDVDA